MQITTITTDGLGDRSYLIQLGTIAVVIDPQRDIDRVLDLLSARDLTLALVCETHIHNDYVTGGLALARRTGADYLINDLDDVSFERRGVSDGEVIQIDGARLEIAATPGHTPHHLAYTVRQDGEAAVFTGGSMLYGTVGRTDLLGEDLTDALTRAQFRSVRHLAKSLPGEVSVHPTHGFGSFCASSGGGSRESGTVADERRENLACTIDDEDEFVTTLTAGLSAYPPYYAHMGLLNKAGPTAPDLSPPPVAGPEELGERIAAGEWVVDLRPRQDFADAHIPGSINADVSGSLATYLGWAIPWGTPFSLAAPGWGPIAEAQRELVRIGLDRPLSAAVGEVGELAGGATGSYRAATFEELGAAPDAQVLDVRRADERDEGHIRGSIHLPLERVAGEAANLPDGPLWVHCASGYRASIAASLIARAGKDVTLIDDDYDNAKRAGREIVTAAARSNGS